MSTILKLEQRKYLFLVILGNFDYIAFSVVRRKSFSNLIVSAERSQLHYRFSEKYLLNLYFGWKDLFL